MAAIMCRRVVCSGVRSGGGGGSAGGWTCRRGQYPSSSSMKLMRFNSSSLNWGNVECLLDLDEGSIVTEFFLRENHLERRFSSSIDVDFKRVFECADHDSLHLSLSPDPRPPLLNLGALGTSEITDLKSTRQLPLNYNT